MRARHSAKAQARKKEEEKKEKKKKGRKIWELFKGVPELTASLQLEREEEQEITGEWIEEDLPKGKEMEVLSKYLSDEDELRRKNPIYDFVEIYWDSPLLKDGSNLYDSPGVCFLSFFLFFFKSVKTKIQFQFPR